MIYYFSATGNNKYVAERVAEAVGTQAVSIQERIDSAQIEVDAGEQGVVGFVSPTYACGLPEIFKHFFRKVSLGGGGRPYVFFAATYGTTPGFTGQAAKRMLAERGIAVSAFYSIRMPDNWTVAFDLSDAEKVAETNRRADEEISVMLERIRERRSGNFMRRTLPYFAAPLALRLYEKMRRTSFFSVDENCAGCGLCEKKCPDRAIAMRDGKPCWVKEQCIMCLGCLHRCPKFSIQYGNRTREHGQYRHPKS